MPNEPGRGPSNRSAAGVATPTGRGQPQAVSLPVPAQKKDYDLRVFQALRRVIRAVDLHSRKLVAQHAITGPQLICLTTISEHQPISASRIAQEVHLSPSTVVGILDRLEAKDLVRRERDTNDRRVVHVFVTEPGTMLLQSAPPPLQGTLADAMLELPDAEQAAIIEALERIVDMMEAREIDAAPILETGPLDPEHGSQR